MAHTKAAAETEAEAGEEAGGTGGKAYVNMAKDMRIGKGKSQDISNLKCDFATKTHTHTHTPARGVCVCVFLAHICQVKLKG